MGLRLRLGFAEFGKAAGGDGFGDVVARAFALAYGAYVLFVLGAVVYVCACGSYGIGTSWRHWQRCLGAIWTPHTTHGDEAGGMHTEQKG